MSEQSESLKAIEERLAALERQVAFLMKRNRPSAQPNRANDYRDRYDTLEYPER